MSDIIIKIEDEEYKLLITLGFWKNLSFPRSEINLIYSDGKKLAEVLKLALFYGNKKEFGWNCIDDMKLTITDEDIDNIDTDPQEIIAEAFLEYFPEKVKEELSKAGEDSKDEKKN